jgi:RNA polymerase sigma-70 factor (ECF subfamily)
LRNLFRSEYRKRRREVEDGDGSYADSLTSAPEQTGRLELSEFREALDSLPEDQREALLLVGACGFSYEEAAQVCQTRLGTIKSRVNRARKLAEVLSIEGVEGSDPAQKSCRRVNSLLATRCGLRLVRSGITRIADRYERDAIAKD